MDAVEWNKKEELVADQALKHLRVYAPLFEANTTSDRAELTLLVKVQEFCYDNMNFMKVFQKIVILFYKCEYCEIYLCIIFTVTYSTTKISHFFFFFFFGLDLKCGFCRWSFYHNWYS